MGIHVTNLYMFQLVFLNFQACVRRNMLGSEVKKPSKFWSKYQMQKNILNQILKHQGTYLEQMFLQSSIYEKTYISTFTRFSNKSSWSCSSV